MIRSDVVSSLSPVHSSDGLRICGQKHAFPTCTNTLKSKAYSFNSHFVRTGKESLCKLPSIYVGVPHLSIVMTGLAEVEKIARV